MRLIPAVALALTGLATCSTPPRASEPNDLKIDLALALEGGKCVVRFVDTRLKEPAHAVAWTNHLLIWRIVRNDCGEKLADKGGKALGLRYLKRKDNGNPARWFDRCGVLNVVPTRFKTPPEIRCYIPSAETWPADRGQLDGVHEYEIDGDSVEPLDPGTDIRRNG